MANYSLEQKMQVCGYCPKRKDDNLFFGEEYCKEVGATIAEIGSCPAWEDFWKFDLKDKK
jgi:hypothetical protein